MVVPRDRDKRAWKGLENERCVEPVTRLWGNEIFNQLGLGGGPVEMVSVTRRYSTNQSKFRAKENRATELTKKLGSLSHEKTNSWKKRMTVGSPNKIEKKKERICGEQRGRTSACKTP